MIWKYLDWLISIIIKILHSSLANEVVTSADTPSSELDREEYYDDFNFISGERHESFLPNQNNPSQAIPNQENTTIDTAITDNDVVTETVTTDNDVITEAVTTEA